MVFKGENRWKNTLERSKETFGFSVGSLGHSRAQVPLGFALVYLSPHSISHQPIYRPINNWCQGFPEASKIILSATWWCFPACCNLLTMYLSDHVRPVQCRWIQHCPSGLIGLVIRAVGPESCFSRNNFALVPLGMTKCYLNGVT